MLHYEPSLWKEYYQHVKYNPVCIESHKCTFKGRIVCIKYKSRPVHDMLKNILGYIHGKVRMLFTGIEICKIKVITKLPNSEQSYKGKVQTHNYINRQNQSTTGKL